MVSVLKAGCTSRDGGCAKKSFLISAALTGKTLDETNMVGRVGPSEVSCILFSVQFLLNYFWTKAV